MFLLYRARTHRKKCVGPCPLTGRKRLDAQFGRKATGGKPPVACGPGRSRFWSASPSRAISQTLVVNGVDSVGTALVGGLIAGVIIGAAGWFGLRRQVSWLWIPATSVGMAVGLAAGAALVDYGIYRGDLLLMGAVTGLGVGVLQALVLARHRIPGAFWWALVNPPAWALAWLVTSYVITANVKEQFAVFGGSGAIVFGLLTWLLLAVLFRATAPKNRETAATAAR